MPQVSIIIPVYNAEHVLVRCIKSILMQDYDDWEAIFVDDGSRDGSADILIRYAEEDVRIRYLSQANAGPGAARNAGMRLATGEFLQFLDADDELPAGAIRALVEAMDGMDLAIGHFELCIGDEVSRRGLIKQLLTVNAEEFLELVIKWPGAYYYSAMWNKMYRRAVVERADLRFDEHIIWGEDCLFNMQYFCDVRAARYIPVIVYRYHRKLGGLSWGSVFQLHKGVRIKAKIYRALRHLYIQAGMYSKHRFRVYLYIFNVTLMD